MNCKTYYNENIYEIIRSKPKSMRYSQFETRSIESNIPINGDSELKFIENLAWNWISKDTNKSTYAIDNNFSRYPDDSPQPNIIYKNAELEKIEGITTPYV